MWCMSSHCESLRRRLRARDSNVCGFTANKFLSLALAKLLKIFETEPDDDPEARQEQLYEYLSGLTTKATVYGTWQQRPLKLGC